MAKDKSSDAPQDVSPKATEEKAQEAAEAFFRWKYLDGDEKVFQTKEDLEKGFRESYLRRQDMDRQINAINEEKAKWMAEREQLVKDREHERSVAQQYLDWDRRLKSDQSLYQQIEGIMNGQRTQSPSIPQENTELLERLEKLENMLSERDQETAAERAYAEMMSKYQDFDRDAATELIHKMEQGDYNTLLEVAYQATRGYGISSPQVQEQVGAEGEQAGLMSQSGSQAVPASNGKGDYADLNEATKAAYEAYGITPGE